jgi:methylmalonyl-CoA mutase C-terminal domain/subunit
VAAVVVQEDVDLVGLSSLSGNHLTECARVLAELGKADASEVLVVLGGTVPRADEAALAEMGVDAVFGTGSSLPAVVGWIADALTERRPTRA